MEPKPRVVACIAPHHHSGTVVAHRRIIAGPPWRVLGLLVKDEDAEVRRIVAARMLPDDAPRMLADSDWVVRLEAAQRAPVEALAELANDAEPDVRAAVRQRMDEFLRRDDK